MKAKQVKIYSFERSCIEDGVITSGNLHDYEVTLSESFLTIALECYRNIKLEDGQLVEEIIKVLLPNTEEKAKEEWDHGLVLNDKVYFAWFATPGGMKQEKAMGKCETFFIREDFCSFATEFEDLISLGKFKEIEEDRNGKKRTRIEKTKRYMPPNPTAQAFWLKNRKKDEWGDRKEIIFDTKGQEEERKLQFLKMINEEIVDADYSVVEEAAMLPYPEVIEETEEGFMDEFEEDDFGDETTEA
jgi:hypothetical protein